MKKSPRTKIVKGGEIRNTMVANSKSWKIVQIPDELVVNYSLNKALTKENIICPKKLQESWMAEEDWKKDLFFNL